MSYSPRRVLVTGAVGFVGRHLVEYLQSYSDLEVIGTGRRAPEADGSLRIEHVRADLTVLEQVETLVRVARPDFVVHLAAQPSVAESWRDPVGTITNNLVAQQNLLQCLVAAAPEARVLVVGSSEEYGLVHPEDLPVDEETPLRPDNPYAVSKIAQDYLGLQFFLGRRLPVVRVRPFNLFGPRQSDRFALGSFARQIAEAEAGLRAPEVVVGNLAARRDFTDVRDAVRAYWLALERGTPGEVYNVGGGGVRAVGDLLDALVARARVKVAVRVDPDRFRPVEAPSIAADVSRIREELGWEARIPFETTIDDILDDWRERVRQSAPAR